MPRRSTASADSLAEAEQLVGSIRAKGARLAVPGLVDLSDFAAEADGVAKIVLESVQELLLKLALQMARDDYETRRERQRQGVQLAKASGKYKGRKPDGPTHHRIVALRELVIRSRKLPSWLDAAPARSSESGPCTKASRNGLWHLYRSTHAGQLSLQRTARKLWPIHRSAITRRPRPLLPPRRQRLALIAQKRGEHNRLGFAVQLCTVRYLGTFLEDPLTVPTQVLHTLAKQLRIAIIPDAHLYSASRQRLQHAAEIQTHYGYVEITERQIGFHLTRWLYAICWTGTDRPTVLFERAVTWLVTHKVLLPGSSTLERYIARLRSRVEERLWLALGRGISSEQQGRLESLLLVPLGSRSSPLDQLRKGPVMVSSRSLVIALMRLHSVRELGIRLPAAARIPATRVAALARFAGAAKVSAILRLPNPRRLATLVAFVHCLEASAQDDGLEVLEVLLRELFGDAIKADKKSRLRTLKDLDQAAATLASACQMLLDTSLPDGDLRTRLFEKIPRNALTLALEGVNALIRPADNVYYQELDAKYKTVRCFLPALVEHIRFGANVAGEPVVAAFDWLRSNIARKKPGNDAPRGDQKTVAATCSARGWQR